MGKRKRDETDQQRLARKVSNVIGLTRKMGFAPHGIFVGTGCLMDIQQWCEEADLWGTCNKIGCQIEFLGQPVHLDRSLAPFAWDLRRRRSERHEQHSGPTAADTNNPLAGNLRGR